jgi:hypothetical protein
MKGKHDVYIIEAGGGYRVRPAAFSVDPKRANPKVAIELLIRNLTPFKVVITFPDIVDDTDPNESADVILLKVGTKEAGTNKPLDSHPVKLKEAIDPGAYPYSVVVLTKGGPVAAIGDSEPVVIIDPPS